MKVSLLKQKKFSFQAVVPKKVHGYKAANKKIILFNFMGLDNGDGETKITIKTKNDIVKDNVYYADGLKKTPDYIVHTSGGSGLYDYDSNSFRNNYGFVLKCKLKKGENNV